MDIFIKDGKILICAIHRERSGSYLMKIRIEDTENGSLVNDLGQATQNNTVVCTFAEKIKSKLIKT